MTVTPGPDAAPPRPTPPRPAPAGAAPVGAVPGGTPAASAAPGAHRSVTDEAAEPSIGQLVAQASEHLSTLVHSEIELAKLELRATVKNAGTGAGAFIGALVVLVFSLTFGFIALAEGLAALGLARWLSFLIVFAFQLLIVGALVFVGIRKIKRVKAPERTIATSKETVAYLRKHS